MLSSSENYNFDLLKGNESFKEAVASMSDTGRFPHAFLITGEEGCGKKTAAKYLGAALLCTEKKGPCLKCASCRKVQEMIHPDLKFLTPDESGFYKVGDIRALRSDVVVKPNEAIRKVYIIDKADKMNINAANSLLKCLEEPPAGVVFVLLADDEKKIIETIVSRTVRFRVSPLSEEVFVSEFGERGHELFVISGGNLGRARAIASESEASVMDDAVGFIKRAIFGDGYDALKFIKNTGYKKNEILDFLNCVTVIMKNAAVGKSLSSRIISGQEDIAKSLSNRKIIIIIDEVGRLREYAMRNVAPESILMLLYFKIKG